jgi:hypothetical protein
MSSKAWLESKDESHGGCLGLADNYNLQGAASAKLLQRKPRQRVRDLIRFVAQILVETAVWLWNAVAETNLRRIFRFATTTVAGVILIVASFPRVAGAQTTSPRPAMSVYQAPVYGPSNRNQLSYLRLYNSTGSAGIAEFTYVNSSAQRLGLVREAVRSKSSLQLQVNSHLSQFTSSDVAAVYVRANFDGLLSHVVWNSGGGSLTNMTSCGPELASQTHTLINVHTGLISEYPSIVGIYNQQGTPRQASLTVYDSITGSELGRFLFAPILGQSSSMMNATSILSEILSAQRIHHVNLVLDAGFNGHLVHFVDNLRSRVLTNMKDACVIVGDKTLN